MDKPKTFDIAVKPADPHGEVLITIDGESTRCESFEFSAPVGYVGLRIKKIMRVEIG